MEGENSKSQSYRTGHFCQIVFSCHTIKSLHICILRIFNPETWNVKCCKLQNWTVTWYLKWEITKSEKSQAKFRYTHTHAHTYPQFMYIRCIWNINDMFIYVLMFIPKMSCVLVKFQNLRKKNVKYFWSHTLQTRDFEPILTCMTKRNTRHKNYK